MLEEAAHDTADPDRIGQSWNSRAKRADSAHPQVDRHARDRSLVERIDYCLVDDRVALHPNPRLATLTRQPHLLVDPLDQPGSEPGRGDEHPVIFSGAAVPGQVIEQVRDVL